MHKPKPFVCFAALLAATSTSMTWANSHLDSLMTDLYGGDGITLATTAIFDHSAHFQNESLVELERLSVQAFDVSIPLPSGDGGGVFVYDPVMDDFVEGDGSLGTIFAERAGTLGKGRMGFGVGFQRIEFNQFEGGSLNDLRVNLSHRETGGPGPDVCVGGPAGACHIIELDYVQVSLDLDFTLNVTTFFGSYGLTDRWDIGVIVPLVDAELSIDATAEVIEHETAPFSPGVLHGFDPAMMDGDVQTSSVSGSDRGLGDIHLRTKYLLAEMDRGRVALSGHVRLPTGDHRNLRGLDSYGGELGVFYSHEISFADGLLSPHLNLNYEFNAGKAGQDEIDLIAGLEYLRAFGQQKVSLTIDLLMSEEVNHKDGVGDSVYDTAFALRWRPNERSAVYLGAQLPVNDRSGIRSDLISHFGFFVSL